MFEKWFDKHFEKRYNKTLKKLKNKEVIRVAFLNCDSSKWVYQSLYEQMASDDRFEPFVLVSVDDILLRKKYAYLNYKQQLKDNYEFFKNRGMNVEYAFANGKYIDLKKFNPDIVFYEQPWHLPKLHDLGRVSKFALTYYVSYGSSTTNGTNEYKTEFFSDVFRYYLDNAWTKSMLEKHGCIPQRLVVSGSLKLDAYKKPLNPDNLNWRTTDRKRIIWAPHHSFFEGSQLGFGTFDWTYKFMYNYAKEHSEYEFIMKPHPELKRQMVRHLMSVEDAEKYFEMWRELPNAQVIEGGDYYDMFRTSDLMITDCNSFLFEYLPNNKPLIHLIGKNSVGFNEFGQKIISGYYDVHDIDELKQAIEKILVNGHDTLFEKRSNILKNDVFLPQESVAKFIAKNIENELKNN